LELNKKIKGVAIYPRKVSGNTNQRQKVVIIDFTYKTTFCQLPTGGQKMEKIKNDVLQHKLEDLSLELDKIHACIEVLSNCFNRPTTLTKEQIINNYSTYSYFIQVILGLIDRSGQATQEIIDEHFYFEFEHSKTSPSTGM
jgi:hypothetical protein